MPRSRRSRNNIPIGRDGLAPRQREMLAFIKVYMRRRRYAPSIEDIRQHFGLSSWNGVHQQLRVLERVGKITRSPGVARSIVVL